MAKKIGVLATQMVDVKSIVPNQDNPRIIKDDKFVQLVRSIKEFPEMLQLRPIVVDENMVILGGNMRFKALLEAGYTNVPIVKIDTLTEQQKKEFIIKDNVGFGEWDWDILANEWDNELLGDWGLDVWQPSEAGNLDDLFELQGEAEAVQKFKITLEYSEDDYAEITELFKKYAGTKEEIVFNLLAQ
jgi:hypothetical protein